jgi:hypothetical protein
MALAILPARFTILQTHKNYEDHHPLDTGGVLRVYMPQCTFLCTEQSGCRMVEAGILFLLADVFLLRWLCDIADAKRDSGVAEAGHRFARQASEFT